jgi:acyl-coenzyme A synthetase/AMP-(fatty) acid ligase
MNNLDASHLDAQEPFVGIVEAIESLARQTPDAAALLLPERQLTYGQLIEAVHAIAHKMLSSGVRPGQILGMSMMQTPLHLMTMLAIARIGAVSLPVHITLPQAQRRELAQRFGASAIVSGLPALRLHGMPFIDLSHLDLTPPAAPLPPHCFDRASPFRIVLSSGTTTVPKGVLYNQGYMLERTRRTAASCAFTAGSRLLPMDLNFSIGFVYAIGALLAGSAIVFGRNTSPAEFPITVRTHAVTHWLLSPAMAEEIGQKIPGDTAAFPSLTHLRLVGGKPSRRVLKNLFTRFSPNVFEHYGCTEIGPIAVASPDLLRRFPDCAGRLAPDIEAQVVDAHGVALPAGESGRLRLREANMIKGYYLAPALSADRFCNGWFYTRDLARIDTDGLLYLEGREDNVLNLGGRKVYPEVIEEALRSHPAVSEAAVFTLNKPDGCSTLVAAYTASSALSEGDLQAWARKALGADSPEQLFRVTDWPRTPTGKILRDALALQLASALV